MRRREQVESRATPSDTEKLPPTHKPTVTLTPEPSRAKARKETARPMIMKSNTDRLLDSVWKIPLTDRLLPSLPYARIEIELPSAKESKVDTRPASLDISPNDRAEPKRVHRCIETPQSRE